MQFTKQQEDEFFAYIARAPRSDKIYFYKVFEFFSKKFAIEFNLDEESDEEQRLYNKALEMGLVGFKVLKSYNSSDEIFELFENYFNKVEEQYFLFSYHFQDEELLSLTKVYEKWDELPPKGWFGRFCSCGKFFPISLEITEMGPELNEVYDFFQKHLRPREIEIVDIVRLDICSDNILRFNMKNGTIINCKALKMDMGVNFAFIGLENLL